MSDAKEVSQLREVELLRIKEDVDHAFDNRRQQDLDISKGNTTESLDRARRLNDVIGKLTDLGVDFMEEEFKKDPSMATVDNSHDYKALLTAAFNKLADVDQFNRKDIEAGVASVLEHEFGHHVPAIGQEGLRITYGVEFIEDMKPMYSFIGFTPFIHFSGRIDKSVFLDSVVSASGKSSTDEEILG